jgi:hypothetical protein
MKIYGMCNYDHISLNSFSGLEIFWRNAVEKIKTHFVFGKFFPENCSVYEIAWKNKLRPEQATDGASAWLTKTTDRHSEYVRVTFIPFPLQQLLQERASLLRYTHIVSLVKYH